MSSLKQRHNWVPLVFLLGGLFLVLQLGSAARDNEAERINVETRITAEQLKLRIESCFASRVGVVRTLAGYPWQSAEQVLSDWSERAGSLFPLYSGVQALNYVDLDGVIRVVYPEAPNRAALSANLRRNPNPSVVRAVFEADATGNTTRTDIVELLQGGKGFALYRAIPPIDGESPGFVNGVFRVEALMESCLPEGRLRQNFSFAVFDQGAVFYEQIDPESGDSSPYQVDLQIDVVGEPWRFTISPLQSYLAATDSPVDETWVGVGVLLVTLLTLVLRYALVQQRDVKAREDEYRLLVENQSDLVIKVNVDGEFQYVSPSYCEMFGKSEDELIGHAFMPLVHEDDRELTAKSLRTLQQPPFSSYHEQRTMTKSGWRWLAWSNRAVLDENQKLVGITAVGRDVTEVKRLEERIAHSQKMRAMGELAGGITHDFNNLLQVILGNIEFLLLDKRHDAETRRSMAGIRDIAVRAMNLTKKLATLSRQDVTRRQNVDLNGFLGELETLLGHTLPASVRLDVSLPDASIKVNADRSQLEQVLLNLCFNARDAVDSKGRILLRVEETTVEDRGMGPDPQLEAGDYVVVIVEDNGHGIEADDLPRIFDPFFTTKGAATGTGLGLANSYSIIEQHGGTISVESTPGEGSRFSVFLPLASGDTPDAVDGSETGRPLSTAGRETDGLVLIADDNPQLTELAGKVLEKAGYETCVASDGVEALAMYRERREAFRLLILDLVMPGLGGQEVARAVREMSDDVRILFVSGYVPEETKKSLSEPVLRKPYTIDELMQALDDLL